MSFSTEFRRYMFNRAAESILAREDTRVNYAAALAEWEKDLGYETEVRMLKKLLTATGTIGRPADDVIKRYSNNPHPLSDYLAENPCPPDTVSACLGEVRQDFEKLLVLAEKGDGI
ncbi:MAG: hypothetical protein LBK08_05845 [Treponema sp.]|jgi:hypothetical protein|nr:hypothetical protein [Treponema sp.]